MTRLGKLAKLLETEKVLVLGREMKWMACGLPLGVWRRLQMCKGFESNALDDIYMPQ